jgi:hypothetical protein
VYAFEAGQNVMWDQELTSGWRHIAAVRTAERLRLYVDGVMVAQSRTFPATEYDLESKAPLQIGTGSNGRLRSIRRDVRVYDRAITPAEVRALAQMR